MTHKRTTGHRRFTTTRLALAGATLAGSAALAAGPADADPLDAADPTAEAAAGCSLSPYVVVRGNGPYIGGTASNLRVFGNGEIWQPNPYYCFVDRSSVATQSKHCGTWGCNWHTNGSVAETPRTPYWSRTADQACRTGTHRYRTRTTFAYRAYDYSGPVPVLVPAPPISDNSPDPEFTCAPK